MKTNAGNIKELISIYSLVFFIRCCTISNNWCASGVKFNANTAVANNRAKIVDLSMIALQPLMPANR